MSISSIWSEFKSWWNNTTIGQEIDEAGTAAENELATLVPEVLLSVTESTAAPIISGLASGSATSAIIAAGIDAAEAALKAASSSLTSTTISTFVSSLHNSITNQTAAGLITATTAAVTPAA